MVNTRQQTAMEEQMNKLFESFMEKQEDRRLKEKQEGEERRLKEKQEEEEKRLKEKQEEAERRREEEERFQNILQQQEERRLREKQEEAECRRNEQQMLQGWMRELIGAQTSKLKGLEDEIREVRTDMEKMEEKVDNTVAKVCQEVDRLQKDFAKLRTQGTTEKTFVSSGSGIKPPTYDGQVSWTVYKRQFEAAAIANNWDKEEMARALIVALRGPALELLQTLTPAQQGDYKALVLALERRYGDYHRSQLYQAQVKTKHQRSGETLQEFESEIRRLVYLAYPNAPSEFQEELAAQYFIDGLKDQEIQRTLRLAKFVNSSEALVRALEVEAAYNVSRPKIRAVTIKDEDQQDLGNQIKRMSENIERLLQGNSSWNQNRSNECYRCGRTGHFKKEIDAGFTLVERKNMRRGKPQQELYKPGVSGRLRRSNPGADDTVSESGSTRSYQSGYGAYVSTDDLRGTPERQGDYRENRREKKPEREFYVPRVVAQARDQPSPQNYGHDSGFLNGSDNSSYNEKMDNSRSKRYSGNRNQGDQHNYSGRSNNQSEWRDKSPNRNYRMGSEPRGGYNNGSNWSRVGGDRDRNNHHRDRDTRSVEPSEVTYRNNNSHNSGKMGAKPPSGRRHSTTGNYQYNFMIKHRPGKQHANADSLSRRPCPKNCSHCQRIDQRETTIPVGKISFEPEREWTTSEYKNHQLQDPDIGPFLELKGAGKSRPSWAEISNKGLTFKALWAQWDSLEVENGLLKRRWESTDGKHTLMQLLVPRSKVAQVLEEIHGGKSGGHLGVNKTIDKIRERFYWVHYCDDVKSWCRRCLKCEASKGHNTRSRGRMEQYNVGLPFERMAIDVAGPFPETDKGNKYILVATDYFSKWPEVFAIPNQEATTVATVLVDNVFSRFGVPLELHSDQGRNFESRLFQKLCDLLGINKTRTTPLHPQSDGMVERFNKTIEEHLSKVVDTHQRDWDQHIPAFLMAYRSAVHDTIGLTPARVLFGRELRLPCDLMFGIPDKDHYEINDYVDELKERLLNIHELARTRINVASDRMKTRYDLRANSSGFQNGDQVWLYNPQRKKGRSPKLTPAWDGPYTVLKRINDVVYRVQRSPRSKMKVVHLDRLKKFHKDPETDRDDQF